MNWQNDDTYLSKWLNDELDPEEKASFENSPEGKDFIALVKASDELTTSKYDIEGSLAGLKDKIENHQAPQQKQIWFQPLLKYGAVAAVLVIGLFLFLFPFGNQTFSTAYGEQQKISLPDGSEIILNANSSVTFNKNSFPENRFIKLEGEAFFDVEKGSDFSVKTENGLVTVLGTSFNVNSRKAYYKVHCFTGKVKVERRNQSVVLTRGMTSNLKSGNLETSNQLNRNKPDWINGIVSLEAVPIQIALEELTHQFGIEIEFETDLEELIYTGSFPNSNPKTAIQLVLDPLNISYTYNQQENTLLIHGTTE